MKIEEIKQMIDKDSAFLKDEVNIDIAGLSVPELCGRYLQLIYDETLTLRYFSREYDVMVRKRTEFYLGKADPEEYKKEPMDLKILRSDVSIYLKSDNQLNECRDKVIMQEEKINLIQGQVKSIMSVSFNIGNTIKWKNYLAGNIG